MAAVMACSLEGFAVKFAMMGRAQPTHVERAAVVIVVSFGWEGAADLARLPLKLAPADLPLET